MFFFDNFNVFLLTPIRRVPVRAVVVVVVVTINDRQLISVSLATKQITFYKEIVTVIK